MTHKFSKWKHRTHIKISNLECLIFHSTKKLQINNKEIIVFCSKCPLLFQTNRILIHKLLSHLTDFPHSLFVFLNSSLSPSSPELWMWYSAANILIKILLQLEAKMDPFCFMTEMGMFWSLIKMFTNPHCVPSLWSMMGNFWPQEAITLILKLSYGIWIQQTLSYFADLDSTKELLQPSNVCRTAST